MSIAHAAHSTGTRAVAGTTTVLTLPGARLAYQVRGDGPAVVLVHGFWTGHDPHRQDEPRLIEALAQFTMEQPGAVNDLLTQFLDELSTP